MKHLIQKILIWLCRKFDVPMIEFTGDVLPSGIERIKYIAVESCPKDEIYFIGATPEQIKEHPDKYSTKMNGVIKNIGGGNE